MSVQKSDAVVRTIRTGIAVGFSSLLTMVVLAPEIIRIFVEGLGGHLPDETRIWLLGLATFTTALATTVTRVMAIPQVNDFIQKWTSFGIEKSDEDL